MDPDVSWRCPVGFRCLMWSGTAAHPGFQSDWLPCAIKAPRSWSGKHAGPREDPSSLSLWESSAAGLNALISDQRPLKVPPRITPARQLSHLALNLFWKSARW